MNEIVKKATKKNPNDRFDSCGSFIIALKELKEHLSSQSNETLIKKKYIEINVKGITDAFIKINSKEITGSGIIYAAMPGEEVIITIQKEGYKKYTNSLIFSDNIRLDVTLVDEKAPVLSIFRGATQFIELGFHKVLLAIKTAKFGKENKDLISSQKEKIETLKNEHNSTIVEIKKAKMDIIILFMFILIAALIIPLVYNYFNNEPNRSQTPVIKRTVNPPLDPPVEVHKVQINPPSETPPISPTKKINKTEIGSSPKLNNNPNPTVMSIDYRATKIEEESPDSYTEIFEGNYYALIIGTKNQIIQVYRNNKQIARFSLNGKVSSLCYYKGILYTNKNEKSTVRKHYIDFKNNYVHTSDITSVFNKQETKDKYSAPSNSSVIKIIKN